MDKNKMSVIEKKVKRTIKALGKNNMEAFYVENSSEVVAKVAELLCDGDVVAVGGAMTLKETGVMDYLRSGRFNFLDRDKAGATPQDKDRIYRDAFSADAYLASANAITEDGEIYNVDGNSNRVAAIMFGPKKVIIVAGYNKITRDLDEAIRRVKEIASPANCARLGPDTYCRETGECMALAKGQSGMTSGCASKERICCSYTVIGYSRAADRIKVILVGEELGY